MKKIFSILLSVFCVFSFSFCFDTNYTMAVSEEVPKELPELPEDGQVDEDILNEPIFTPEKEKKQESGKFAVNIKDWVLKLLLGALLLVIVVFTASFIWISNVQRINEAKRKKHGADTNVIDAIDNFARHRIK